MSKRNLKDARGAVKARRYRTAARVVGLSLAAVGLAGCSTPPGPSALLAPGRSLPEARETLKMCLANSERPSILENITTSSATRAVDRCMARQGYERRPLSQVEIVALKQRDRYARDQLLAHFLEGGSLETYTGP
ncbi:hypothetical protein [Arenibacterium sp. LLYu02]|uniref:hypothetical protein n=1 Tax=Arenibacterium sp. LLYu02 TaxID=3404132 RepID=UPI003B21F5FD